MRFRLRLLSAKLTYEPDIQVFTAISGPTPHLVAHYLWLAREDGLAGLAEVRANIAFLSRIDERDVAPAIRTLCASLDWGRGPEEILQQLDGLAASHPPIARAAAEGMLVDALAGRDGVAHAAILGGAPAEIWSTNQCLFWNDDATFARLVRRYLGEGFRKLKVRVGVGDLATDLRRLAIVRELGGPAVEIAVDANGSWPAEEAVARCRAMEPLGIAYVEQPTPVHDWGATRRLAGATGIPIMLDEGLQSANDVERLMAMGPPFLAHLKIVKFGGPRAVVRLAKRLQEAGVAVMVGQMNEGGAATALAAAAAMAVRPAHCELYGAYGLVDDAVPVVGYAAGRITLRRDRNLGAALLRDRTTQLWDMGDHDDGWT